MMQEISVTIAMPAIILQGSIGKIHVKIIGKSNARVGA
jgi:hypothetical protein